jgi:hypothetical protein
MSRSRRSSAIDNRYTTTFTHTKDLVAKFRVSISAIRSGISSQPGAIAVSMWPFGSETATLIENALWAQSSSKSGGRQDTYKYVRGGTDWPGGGGLSQNSPSVMRRIETSENIPICDKKL